MEEIEEQEEIIEKTLTELLDEIFEIEENEPDGRKRQEHQDWKNKLVTKYKEYNQRINFLAFPEKL